MSQQYRNVSSTAVSQIQDHAEMEMKIGKHVFDWGIESRHSLAPNSKRGIIMRKTAKIGVVSINGNEYNLSISFLQGAGDS